MGITVGHTLPVFARRLNVFYIHLSTLSGGYLAGFFVGPSLTWQRNQQAAVASPKTTRKANRVDPAFPNKLGALSSIAAVGTWCVS